jgi:putative hydrolase of the HAD superfamily
MSTINKNIKAILLDIGGVMLTNGWDTDSRVQAAELFKLNYAELNSRHRIIFDAYESGKMTLDEYLDLLVFYELRAFSKQEFRNFMLSRSEPYPEMLDFLRSLKEQYGIRTIAVNNEGRELNEYRIREFRLDDFIDVFASSGILRMRKPDGDIYRMALDLAQVKPEEALYLDDRLVFIQAAQRIGINGIHHLDLPQTIIGFETYGLKLNI